MIQRKFPQIPIDNLWKAVAEDRGAYVEFKDIATDRRYHAMDFDASGIDTRFDDAIAVVIFW